MHNINTQEGTAPQAQEAEQKYKASFSSAKINLENGKVFTILAQGVSKANIYIQSVKLNGKIYDKNYITRQDILTGGAFEFIMGSKPNKNWGLCPKVVNRLTN